ncbi:putative peptidoglycan lipid II flippase [Motilibacter peucedani]|uniref:Putative peptidoglycan lipid II flippase n=1 Tax=Motilibacter peucedani TaxID=598650 RepID=A0A420XU62_9ACTN|nr:murein biosynthesis integral membrane protein MurJ [Motilibacter peucedani]RKS80376.1 putative peptidoglycan lipid II flippase [Motilibacter peucedani]
MSLVKSSSLLAVGTVASRVLGLVRSLVLTYAIGTRLVGDTFAVANTVPNMIYLLLVGGVINAVFVPQLVRAAKNDEDGGKAYTDRLLTLTGIALLVLTVVATVAAPLVIRLTYHNDVSGRPLSVLFAYWCLPQIFFYGVYTVLGQVLNSRGVFGPMMWAPIVNNVVAIAVGLLLVRADIEPGRAGSVSHGEAAFLGLGTTLGVVAQAVVLLPYLRAAGYRFTPRTDFRGYGLGKAATLAKWTIGFVLVNQAAYLVVVALAGSAGDQFGTSRGVGINAYQNAYLFFILPHSVITVSLVTVLLPTMSAAAAEGRTGRVREMLSQALRLVGVAIVPSAAGLMLLGETAGAALFGHGANGRADGTYIGIVLAVFAAGLVPFACHHVLLRSFYAYEDTRTPFLIACVVSACNAALALAVTPLLSAEWRTVGLAGVYAVTYWVALAVTATLARRRLGGLDERRVVRTYVRLVLAAVVGGLLGLTVLLGLRRLLGDALGPEVLSGAVAGLVLLLGYLWACARMRVREVGELVGSLRR